MTTIPTLTYPQSDELVIPLSLTTPLSAAADLFVTADRCAALVSVLIETEDRASRTVLCEGYYTRCASYVNSVMPNSRRTFSPS